MKKTLLFAIIALSINAFAQNKQQTSQMHQFSFNSMEKGRLNMLKHEMNPSDKISEKNFDKILNYQKAQLLESNPIWDSVYYWNWDTTTVGWKLEGRTISIVYDENNNPLSTIGQALDGSMWVDVYKIEQTYDANSNMTSLLSQTWNGSDWENQSNSISTYDANNNLTSVVWQNWDGSDWVNSGKYSFTYDANDNQTSEIYQGWNGSNWENHNKHSYTYDANNNQLSELYQLWLEDWVNGFQDIYTYDSNNNHLTAMSYWWNDNAWDFYLRATYFYDEYNNLTSILDQNESNNGWYNVDLTTYTYDANNNQTGDLFQQWYANEWVTTNQYLNSYNAENFVTGESYKYWQFDATNVTSGDSTHYFMQSASGINDLVGAKANIKIYPNPGTGKFTINSSHAFNSVEVYNLLGKQVYSEHLSNQQTSAEIDISNFTKGIYFVKVSEGKSTTTRKILVQ